MPLTWWYKPYVVSNEHNLAICPNYKSNWTTDLYEWKTIVNFKSGKIGKLSPITTRDLVNVLVGHMKFLLKTLIQTTFLLSYYFLGTEVLQSYRPAMVLWKRRLLWLRRFLRKNIQCWNFILESSCWKSHLFKLNLIFYNYVTFRTEQRSLHRILIAWRNWSWDIFIRLLGAFGIMEFYCTNIKHRPIFWKKLNLQSLYKHYSNQNPSCHHHSLPDYTYYPFRNRICKLFYNIFL